jgi:hypothetical protein
MPCPPLVFPCPLLTFRKDLLVKSENATEARTKVLLASLLSRGPPSPSTHRAHPVVRMERLHKVIGLHHSPRSGARDGVGRLVASALTDRNAPNPARRLSHAPSAVASGQDSSFFPFPRTPPSMYLANASRFIEFTPPQPSHHLPPGPFGHRVCLSARGPGHQIGAAAAGFGEGVQDSQGGEHSRTPTP